MIAATFYNAAMIAFQRMTGTAPDADGIAMQHAASEDILAWPDDLEWRCGLDVGEFRVHLVAYCLERDNEWEDSRHRNECALEALSIELNGYLRANNLPIRCASELLHSLSPEDREKHSPYLSSFINTWESFA